MSAVDPADVWRDLRVRAYVPNGCDPLLVRALERGEHLERMNLQRLGAANRYLDRARAAEAERDRLKARVLALEGASRALVAQQGYSGGDRPHCRVCGRIDGNPTGSIIHEHGCAVGSIEAALRDGGNDA